MALDLVDMRTRRGSDESVFVVEVIGLEGPEYLGCKEVPHPRMGTLGQAEYQTGERVLPLAREIESGRTQGHSDCTANTVVTMEDRG